MAELEEARFYEQKFVHDPLWSAREANTDELARWRAIEPLLRSIPREETRRILDVGCGRGWLTALASRYGEATGIEPVVSVARHASDLFPHLRFTSTPLSVLTRQHGFRPADVIVSSEVLEHVARPDQLSFLSGLGEALRPGGWLILSTPRREMFDRWRWLRQCLPARRRAEPDQPVEELLSEREVRELLTQAGFTVNAHARAYVRYRVLSPANAILGIRAVESALAHAGRVKEFCEHRWAVYQVWRARWEKTP